MLLPDSSFYQLDGLVLVPQTGCLKQRQFMFSPFWRPEAENRVSAGPAPAEAVREDLLQAGVLAAGGVLAIFVIPGLVEASPRFCFYV